MLTCSPASFHKYTLTNRRMIPIAINSDSEGCCSEIMFKCAVHSRREFLLPWSWRLSHNVTAGGFWQGGIHTHHGRCGCAATVFHLRADSTSRSSWTQAAGLRWSSGNVCRAAGSKLLLLTRVPGRMQQSRTHVRRRNAKSLKNHFPSEACVAEWSGFTRLCCSVVILDLFIRWRVISQKSC